MGVGFLASRGHGYGMATIRVDGNDVLVLRNSFHFIYLGQNDLFPVGRV
jgi:TPP-dependent pyruvate/acetoin dehydrogenase alpha subunit